MSTYFYGVGADIKNEGKRMINLWHQLGGKVPIYDVKTDQQLQRDKDGFYEQKVREKTRE